MLPQARSWFAAAVLVSAVLLSASSVRSQTFDLEKDRIQIIIKHPRGLMRQVYSCQNNYL
jgi:hypothetical protein